MVNSLCKLLGAGLTVLGRRCRPKLQRKIYPWNSQPYFPQAYVILRQNRANNSPLLYAIINFQETHRDPSRLLG
jgi:hypothetical protein